MSRCVLAAVVSLMPWVVTAAPIEVGARVVLLKTLRPDGVLAGGKRIGGHAWDTSLPCYRLNADAKQTLTNARHGWQKGSVISPESPGYVIRLDETGEEVVACDDSHLAAADALGRAQDRNLVGASLWTLGQMQLRHPDSESARTLKPLTQVKVVALGWGYAWDLAGQGGRVDVAVQVTTADGAGFLSPLSFADEAADSAQRWIATSDAGFRSWPPAVLGVIKTGKVAIGMDEAMVGAACGGQLWPIEGLLRIEADRTVSHAFSCRGSQRFYMTRGQVSAFIESR